MICDDCKHRDKCTKIISESATDCVDKREDRLVVALPNGKFLVYCNSNAFPHKNTLYKNTLSISEMAQIMEKLVAKKVKQNDM